LAWALSALFTRAWMRRAMAGALAVMFIVTAAMTLHTGRIGNTHALTAGFVAHELPRDAVVGAFQSGVVGYFSEHVVNLDGKVNEASLPGLVKGGREAYIDRAGIQYLVDWPLIFRDELDGAWLADHWMPCPTQVPGGVSGCLVRKSE
jgi:hypothetical protein